MYKTQRYIENFLEQSADKPPLSNEITNMQSLTRRVFMNLSKSSLQSQAKKVIPIASAQKLNDASFRNYASKLPKQKLLRFPAFPLNETLDRFLKSAEPLLNDAEMKATKEATKCFAENEGKVLQKLLEDVAECEENWLAGRWLRTAYMQYRDPVTVYSSPSMSFPLQKFKGPDDYLLYAGKVVYGMVKYKETIDNGEVPIVKMGKLELDNSQFEVVYGTCRMPQPEEDTLQYNPDSKYIVVLYKNHFYKMSVYNKNCEPLHPDVLAGEFKRIVDTEKEKGVAYGMLTTDYRENWAKAYAELIKIPGNKEKVEIIQKSLFTVSLDENVTVDGEEFNVLSEQLIHGGGAECNGANRWMDKTIQVVINPNGMSGFCYEHSPAEGQPIALITDYVSQNLKNDKHYECGARGDFECAEKLELKSSIAVEKHLEEARCNINKLARDLHLNVQFYKKYGKEFLKQQKLSPDSFIQIALQYAFFKLHQQPAAQYESAHLRIYYGGRTETIRSCSNESIAFAKAMLDESVGDDCRVELLRKAVNGHRQYTTLALQGRGVDRHLLGLKLMAIENKLPIPEFYKCPGVAKSANFRVSTSQVASAYEAFMAYGPATADGYACCYNPRKNDIILAMSCWRSNKDSDVDKFGAAMCEALDGMYELLGRAGEKPKSKL